LLGKRVDEEVQISTELADQAVSVVSIRYQELN
jgi:transcription elongation GreA/GreB family factor